MPKHEYSTCDTALAAHLLTEGYHPSGSYTTDSVCFFTFYDDTESMNNAILAFCRLEAASCNAAQLIINFRKLILEVNRSVSWQDSRR
ncbi:hypothetical protein LCGC14_0686600 [marine sediment metagenome]|uniref:Uncharacterized protein n=1 Tax=marine sediment metagenome TaxID=412755 RepID=A0A0F9TUM4_9ZZZZ